MGNEAEEWRPIPGYEGFYEASSLGRIRSLDRYVPYPKGSPRFFRGRMLAASSLSAGRYRNVRVRSVDKCVHVLVCTTFHGPRPGAEYEAAHINGDPLDNRASNLRWATASENTEDKRRHGTLDTSGNRKLTWDQVDVIRAEHAQGTATTAELAQRYGVKYAAIWNVVRRKTWVRSTAPDEDAA